MKRYFYFIVIFLAPGYPVHFIPSTLNFPDLPPWLNFIQRNSSLTGFLYGTPTELGDVTIQVGVVYI